ncbi:MAG: hypothetical protein AMJ69_06235 [Gammaproteobacteria bacterium SG8_47]|nr:MAG: hypothetical protein AMJ69_06235 [Gammaproteobacteria bacterium SG8_47]
MNIVGVLVCAHPHHLLGVRDQLSALPGVELHATSAEGRMVVTIEDIDEGPLGDTIVKLNNLEGVLSAAMVYHHCENDLELIEEEGSA